MVEQYDISNSNNYSNFYSAMDNLETCNISSILVNPLYNSYNFICIKCGKIPKIISFKKDKIKIICSCSDSPREIFINNIFEYLNDSKTNNNLQEIFYFSEHKNEKIMIYCKKCENNLCHKCINYCLENNHNCHLLKFDFHTINAINYIKQKLKDKIYEENNNSFTFDKNKNINKKDEDDKVDKSNGNISFNIENNDSFEEDNFLNLFSIIINDFNECPTFENYQNIFTILDYITYNYDKHKEIKFFYKFNKNKIINNNIVELFSDIFVNNNKENLFLVINDNIIELDTFINLKDIYDDNFLKNKSSFTLEVKLIERFNRRVTDFSFMFYNIPLLNLSWDFSNFDTINIDNMSYMFYGCESLKYLPDISKLNTINVKKMQYMFYNCKSLISLPDISKWNTSNLKNISYMFYNCESLSSFPDISNWNNNNIKKMDFIFHNCKHLSSLPSISKWKIKNINNMSYIFYNYKFLTNFLKMEHKENKIKAENEKQIKKNILNNEKLKEQKYHERELKKLNNDYKIKLKNMKLKDKINRRENLRLTDELNKKFEIDIKKIDKNFETEKNKIEICHQENMLKENNKHDKEMEIENINHEEKMTEIYLSHKFKMQKLFLMIQQMNQIMMMEMNSLGNQFWNNYTNQYDQYNYSKYNLENFLNRKEELEKIFEIN